MQIRNNTPLTNIPYKNAKKNPEAAELFFNHQIQESVFDLYLTLLLRENTSFIPELRIDGSEIGPQYSGYYLRYISSKEPIAAILGKFTNCYQSLDDSLGKDDVIMALSEASAGFYGLFEKKDKGKDLVVAQCKASRKLDTSMEFASLESQDEFRKQHSAMLIRFYQLLAQRLVEKFGISRVITGADWNTPEKFGIEFPDTGSNILYTHHSGTHRLVADELFPFLPQIYNESSPLELKSKKLKLSKADIYKWCSYCAFNNKPEWIKYILPYIKSARLSVKDVEAHFELHIDWMKYLADDRKADHISHKLQDISALKSYFYKGVDANFPTAYHLTSLARAASAGQWDIVNWLIKEYRVNVNKKCQGGSGESPLHDAVFSNNPENISLLLRNGADMFAFDHSGYNPLHKAASWDFFDAVKCLVQHGADINSRTWRSNDTVLHVSCNRSDSKVQRWLIENGADVNARGSNGGAYLHSAVHNASLELIQFAIQHKADLSIKDDNGWNVLHRAIYDCCALKKIEYLVSVNKNIIHDKDNEGKLPSHHAAEKREWETLKFLINQGANVNAQDDRGRTVLHTAAQFNNYELIQWLVEHGARVDIADKQKHTALIIAADNCHTFWVSINVLLELGADANTRLPNGRTLLHLASSEGYSEIFFKLLAKGADINARDQHGLRAWNYRDFSSAIQLVKLLVESGADQDTLMQLLSLKKAEKTLDYENVNVLFQPKSTKQLPNDFQARKEVKP